MGTRALVRKLGRLEAARARDGGQVLEALREDPAGLLRSPANRMLLLGSRQADKSSVAAAPALLEARSLVLLLSPSQRQSAEWFRKVMDPFGAGVSARVIDEAARAADASGLAGAAGGPVDALRQARLVP